jgi:hypothetical protein
MNPFHVPIFPPTSFSYLVMLINFRVVVIDVMLIDVDNITIYKEEQGESRKHGYTFRFKPLKNIFTDSQRIFQIEEYSSNTL